MKTGVAALMVTQANPAAFLLWSATAGAVSATGTLNPDSPMAALLWPLLASIAGAITALSFRPYEKMSGRQVFMSLFAAASFSYFMGPWAGWLAFGKGKVDMQVLGGIYYGLALGNNVLIPLVVRKLGQLFGTKEPLQ